jgi:hypothetical protein
VFTIETPISDPFKSLTLRVSFPGSEPIEMIAPTGTPLRAGSDSRRRQIVYRLPLLTPQPILRPGRIVATVIHENGEMEAGSFWVVTLEEAQMALATATATKPTS